LWAYRELLYFLTLRDVKVRYKQTALGAAWAVIQPLFMMLVFSLFLAGWQSSRQMEFLIRYLLSARAVAVAAICPRPNRVE